MEDKIAQSNYNSSIVLQCCSNITMSPLSNICSVIVDIVMDILVVKGSFVDLLMQGPLRVKMTLFRQSGEL